jgi:hypothetical protein
LLLERDPGVAEAVLEDHSIRYLILGLRVRIDCIDGPLRQLLTANFGAMSVAQHWDSADLHYEVFRRAKSRRLLLRRVGQSALPARNRCDLVYLLEKLLILDLQTARPDLLFIHAAAVELDDRVCLLVAESGGGKSTTAWGLLHHGFRYLSDELSPIDLQAMRVLPYPHALCLKAQPPSPYPLPEKALDLGATIHVPASALPGAAASTARPLAALFFVRHVPGLAAPLLGQISPGEASARLFVHTLNSLAHPNQGLDATVRVASHVPGFMISTASLSASCDAIRRAMDPSNGRGTSGPKSTGRGG